MFDYDARLYSARRSRHRQHDSTNVEGKSRSWFIFINVRGKVGFVHIHSVEEERVLFVRNAHVQYLRGTVQSSKSGLVSMQSQRKESFCCCKIATPFHNQTWFTDHPPFTNNRREIAPPFLLLALAKHLHSSLNTLKWV